MEKKFIMLSLMKKHRKFIVDYMEKNNFVYCFQTDAGVVMNKRSEQQILNIMSDMGITEEHLRQLIGEFLFRKMSGIMRRKKS